MEVKFKKKPSPSINVLATLLFNIAKNKFLFGYRYIANQKKAGSSKTKLVCSINFVTVYFLFCRSGCLFSLAQKHKLFQLLVCLVACLFLCLLACFFACFFMDLLIIKNKLVFITTQFCIFP